MSHFHLPNIQQPLVLAVKFAITSLLNMQEERRIFITDASLSFKLLIKGESMTIDPVMNQSTMYWPESLADREESFTGDYHFKPQVGRASSSVS